MRGAGGVELRWSGKVVFWRIAGRSLGGFGSQWCLEFRKGKCWVLLREMDGLWGDSGMDLVVE